MPSLTAKVCGAAGCGVIVRGTYCEKHDRQRNKTADRRRGTSASRGYGARWRKYRASYLSTHPLCVRHLQLGKTIAATTVDHIVPVSQGGEMWDERNHQALCDSCHAGWKQRQDNKAKKAGR